MKTKKLNAAVITLIFSIFSMNQCYAVVNVGDSYGGGTVFCVSQTPDITQCVTQGSGDYGLSMANEDQVNFYSSLKHGVTWSSGKKETKAVAEDDGAANTAAIIAANPKDSPSNNAAWLCHNYRDHEGHTDWYLPSKNELNKMYLYAKANNLIGTNCAGYKAGGVQCLVGGCAYYNNNNYLYHGKFNSYEDVKSYWSSTEHLGGCFAWDQNFGSGIQYFLSIKDNYWLGVRAVRAFNPLTIKQFNKLSVKRWKPHYAEFAEGEINVDTAEAIVSSIATRPELSELTISKVNISNKALQIILNALQATKTLVTLNLCDNNIDHDKIKIIAEWLHNNKTLVTLNLSNNQIGDREIAAMAFALMAHNSLTTIDLSYNKLTNSGAESIISILKTNNILTAIKFGSYDVSSDDSNKISLQNIATINGLLEKNAFCKCSCDKPTWFGGTTHYQLGTLSSIAKCAEACKNKGTNWKMSSCDKITDCKCSCDEPTWFGGTTHHQLGTLSSIAKCAEACKNKGTNWKMGSCDKITDIEGTESFAPRKEL